MASLSFGKFVQILYPHCGYGETEANFIIRLTDKIMEGRPGRARLGKEKKEDQYKNPMRNKSIRTLQAYYKGARPISKRDASILFANSDKYKFEEDLRHLCSDNALQSLEKQLEKALNRKITDKELDVVSFCADLFLDILFELASGNISQNDSF